MILIDPIQKVIHQKPVARKVLLNWKNLIFYRPNKNNCPDYFGTQLFFRWGCSRIRVA